MRVNPEVWSGVDNLLLNYMSVRAGDFVVLAYTPDSWQPATWVSARLEAMEIPHARVWMEPLDDGGFPDRLTERLPSSRDIEGNVVFLSLERDTLSHSNAISQARRNYEPSKSAVFRAISASEELFTTALKARPDELTARNTTILNALMPVDELMVSTSGGSSLTIRLDSSRYRWISNRGSSRPGGGVILPAGEVATYPASVTGTFVADFAFNVNMVTSRDARLNQNPVTVIVDDSRAVEWFCENEEVQRFLDECFAKPHARNVGELGFGTNPYIGDPIEHNSHVNERKPGVHLGFGQHNQLGDTVAYQAEIHLDLIARDATLIFGDSVIEMENLSLSDLPHPRAPDDEDVFAPDETRDDCCGIITSDGLRLS